jgi:hypothetical protein
MRPAREVDALLTLRIRSSTARALEREARRRRRTKSEVARAILEEGLGRRHPDPAAEARRQSLLVSRRESEIDALSFVAEAADSSGWR